MTPLFEAARDLQDAKNSLFLLDVETVAVRQRAFSVLAVAFQPMPSK